MAPGGGGRLKKRWIDGVIKDMEEIKVTRGGSGQLTPAQPAIKVEDCLIIRKSFRPFI